MTSDLSVVHLIMQAGPVVKFVMLILVMASLVSWSFIFAKQNELKVAFEVTNTI